MVVFALLLMQAALQAEASVRASAIILRGERIHLPAPAPGPDRQQTKIIRREDPDAEPVTLRLVEFQ